MLQELQQYFQKHEIEVMGNEIVADGYSFVYQWCPSHAVRIARRYNIPLYDTGRIIVVMLTERIEHIFSTIKY